VNKKNESRGRQIAILAGFCCVALTLRAWSAPFINGGFELPLFGTNSTLALPIGTNISGWTVGGTSSGTLLINGFPPNSIGPLQGAQFIVFDGGNWPTGGTVSQSFDTQLGQRYAVSFGVGKLGVAPGLMKITATVASSNGSVLCALTGTQAQPGWATNRTQLTFIATTATSTLTFEDTSATTTNTDVALDGVLVQPVPPRYRVTKLGAVAGSNTIAQGINNSGDVVGYSQNSNGGHAFRYSGGRMMDLGTLGGVYSQAYAINDNGQVVGDAYTSVNFEQAFLYSGGAMTDLPSSGMYAWARGINNNGQIVGYANQAPSGPQYAFLYSDGTLTNLGTSGYAYGINNNGEVVGQNNITEHAFLYSAGQMIDLGTLGGFSSWATGINNNGQVVGYSNGKSGVGTHAYIYTAGVMTDLGTLVGGSYSYGDGINSSGQIVGYANDRSGAQHAFLYSGGIMTDLNDLIISNSGVTLTEATAINDNGQIAANNGTSAFLLSPVWPLVMQTYGNILLLSWPNVPPVGVLESSTSLDPANWVRVLAAPVQIGGQLVEPVEMSEVRRFYRLRFTGP
jgi:probable HAF family extracellular repeat protein